MLGLALTKFSTLVWPLAVAGVLALLLRPAVDFFERHLRMGRIRAVILLYLLATVLLVVSVAFLLPTLVYETVQFLAALPGLASSAFRWLQERAPWWLGAARDRFGEENVKNLALTLARHLQELPRYLLPALGQVTGRTLQFFGFLTAALLVPVFLFFFLLGRRTGADWMTRLGQELAFLKKETRDRVVFLTGEFLAILVAFFRGQLLISLAAGVLLAIGFMLIGLKFGLVLGLAMGLLNLIPYLGTLLGLLVAVPVAFFQDDGGIWTVIGLLVVLIVQQAIEALVLVPRVMGKKTGLHPLTIIVAILFWGQALDGILGMLLGIPLTAFFVVVWKTFFRPSRS
jgi:predicted PurR-regulated permease PerM